MSDLVILLHGIFRSKTDMLLIERHLKNHGYEVLNILYPSRKKSLEDLVEFVRDKITSRPSYNEQQTIHFVTHSMGGLIARYYIIRHRPINLGRVVMLSPPNSGSEFADFLLRHKLFAALYRKIFGPASDQLTTSYIHINGDIDYPLGIIAGNRSVNPLGFWVLPKKTVGEHDGIVPVARTKIPGMRDHMVMKTTHTFMMFNPKVIRQVEYFLENEKFKT